MATVTRTVYITGSAYELKVRTNWGYNNDVWASVRVLGTKQSSTVRGRIKLYRNGSIISDKPRFVRVYPRHTSSVRFSNVRNSGDIKVEFYLRKTGGSGGTRTVTVNVPK